jgi:hypothetical protein
VALKTAQDQLASLIFQGKKVGNPISLKVLEIFEMEQAVKKQ